MTWINRVVAASLACWAFAAPARSNTSRELETPHASFVTSSAPTTWSPGRPYSGNASTPSNSLANATTSSLRATARRS